ncbi:MAG: DUF1015 domain-containing protein [Deltaproteobacteria bacterium]|nr:DUF1015 domain-containing protein [Deltaproteobacteria bacterium]
MTDPKVFPFRAYTYNPQKVGDISRVVTPPYDVINPEMQRDFYQRSDYNFVRVDLPREPGDLRYEAAKATFQEWLKGEVLVPDAKPAFYFHHQTFTLGTPSLPDSRPVTRKGFFGVRRIEDFSEGGVRPHEKTLEGPKADRLKLTRAVQAQLSPVFTLYSDPGKRVDHLVTRLKEGQPLFDFTTVEGERHQVWRETDPIVCKFVGEFVSDKPVFIADGHHRYETALNYRDECRRNFPPGEGLEPFNYVLMYFTNRDDEGLIILPIHRALHHLVDFELGDFIRMLQKHFTVTPLVGDDSATVTARLAEEGADSHAFVLVTRDPKKSFLLAMKKRAWRHSPVAARVPPSLVDLDVTVLHRLVFEEILRITPQAQAGQENIIYWKDARKAIDETRRGNCEIAFLLNPTRIEEMETAALAGEKMPQKSTYFYPKVPSGLVINPLNPKERLGF